MRRVGPGTASEIEQMRSYRDERRQRAVDPRAHGAQDRVGGVGAVVGAGDAVEGVLRVRQRPRYDAHGALLQEVFSEHTQRTQTGSAPTLNDSRNARRSLPTIVAMGVSRRLPIDP